MEKFRKIMRFEGVTQGQIAQFLGVSNNTITNWFRGKRGRLTVQDAIKVRDKFFPGYTIEQLFGE